MTGVSKRRKGSRSDRSKFFKALKKHCESPSMQKYLPSSNDMNSGPAIWTNFAQAQIPLDDPSTRKHPMVRPVTRQSSPQNTRSREDAKQRAKALLDARVNRIVMASKVAKTIENPRSDSDRISLVSQSDKSMQLQDPAASIAHSTSHQISPAVPTSLRAAGEKLQSSINLNDYFLRLNFRSMETIRNEVMVAFQKSRADMNSGVLPKETLLDASFRKEKEVNHQQVMHIPPENANSGGRRPTLPSFRGPSLHVPGDILRMSQSRSIGSSNKEVATAGDTWIDRSMQTSQPFAFINHVGEDGGGDKATHFRQFYHSAAPKYEAGDNVQINHISNVADRSRNEVDSYNLKKLIEKPPHIPSDDDDGSEVNDYQDALMKIGSYQQNMASSGLLSSSPSALSSPASLSPSPLHEYERSKPHSDSSCSLSPPMRLLSDAHNGRKDHQFFDFSHSMAIYCKNLSRRSESSSLRDVWNAKETFSPDYQIDLSSDGSHISHGIISSPVRYQPKWKQSSYKRKDESEDSPFSFPNLSTRGVKAGETSSSSRYRDVFGCHARTIQKFSSKYMMRSTELSLTDSDMDYPYFGKCFLHTPSKSSP